MISLEADSAISALVPYGRKNICLEKIQSCLGIDMSVFSLSLSSFPSTGNVWLSLFITCKCTSA